MHVTQTSETQSQTEQLEPAAPGKRSSRKSILALSLLALAVNGTAAVYTLPSFDMPDFSGLVAELLPPQAASAPIPDDRVAALALPSFELPNFVSLAEEFPQHEASAPKPDPVVAALKDIQSAQQQHAVALQDNAFSLQQNTALLQHDSIALASLRQSITDEQVDVKKISAQLSTLIAKVDWLQNAIRPEITSSIPKGRARNRLSGLVRKRMARLPKPLGPVSVGGAPLSFPARTSGPEG
jgi:hypothetical protein